MKTLLLLLVAALVAEQALADDVQVSTFTTVRNGYLGLMKGKKFPCSQPDPKKYTFAWANTGVLLPQDTVSGSPGGATGNICVDVCGLGYRLAAVSFPLPSPPEGPSGPPPPPSNDTPYLCRVKYTSQNNGTRYLYGYYVSPQSAPSFQIPPTSTTVPTTGVCRVESPEDGVVIEATPVVGDSTSFDCGCCGTINRDGRRWDRGCPIVTDVVDKDKNCPSNRTWTAPSYPPGALPGTDICIEEVTPSDVIKATMVFGTIDPTGNFTNGRCYAADPNIPAGNSTEPKDMYQRFCYKINAYSGPPAPDCKNKHRG